MKRTSSYLTFGAMALALVIIVGSCKDDNKLPAIDGYNSVDDVAADNLVAHWGFDGDQKESISGTAPSNTYGTVGSTTGQVGSALQLTKGALVYPSIDKINTANALSNFSVSLWVKAPGVKGQSGIGFGFMPLFALIPTGATDIWGDIVAGVEAGQHLPSSDTIVLKNVLNTHPPGAANSLQDNLGKLNDGKGKDILTAKEWTHYVMTWDGTTHQFRIYANGAASGAFDDRGTTPVLTMAVPVKPVFGSLAAQDIGFTNAPVRAAEWPMATASVDEVRVYSTVLSQVEITALLNFGTAGR